VKTCRNKLHTYLEELKQCPKCADDKNKQYYQDNKVKINEQRKQSKDANLINQKMWDKKHPSKVKANRLRRYWPNCTSEQCLINYNQLLVEQNNCCAICSRHKSNFKRDLDVDHCHKTGKVRGLLCVPCNTSMGLLQEHT